MKKKSAKQTVRGSLRATSKLMSKLGGRPTAASGAWLEKGDGRVPGKFRVETKCPPTGRYRFTFKEWKKLHEAAISAHEVAVFHLKLKDVELIILREQDFVGLGGNPRKPFPYCLSAGQSGYTITDMMWKVLSIRRAPIYFRMKGLSEDQHPFFVIDLPTFLRLTKESS